MMENSPTSFSSLYDGFDAPVTAIDCGLMCAPFNASGKPFCCDICHAVPAAYLPEWHYLEKQTDLWHVYRGDECIENPGNPQEMLAETPEHMLLLACKGPAHCQRNYRAISCRQFPFFPYISADDQFIGLAYEWTFEETCWVISNLGAITSAYRQAFVGLYDTLFAHWEHDFDSFAGYAEDMRVHFAAQKRRIPILHRNGGFYLLSPTSERMQRVTHERLRQFGPYQAAGPSTVQQP